MRMRFGFAEASMSSSNHTARGKYRCAWLTHEFRPNLYLISGTCTTSKIRRPKDKSRRSGTIKIKNPRTKIQANNDLEPEGRPDTPNYENSQLCHSATTPYTRVRRRKA